MSIIQLRENIIDIIDGVLNIDPEVIAESDSSTMYVRLNEKLMTMCMYRMCMVGWRSWAIKGVG